MLSKRYIKTVLLISVMCLLFACNKKVDEKVNAENNENVKIETTRPELNGDSYYMKSDVAKLVPFTLDSIVKGEYKYNNGLLCRSDIDKTFLCGAYISVDGYANVDIFKRNIKNKNLDEVVNDDINNYNSKRYATNALNVDGYDSEWFYFSSYRDTTWNICKNQTVKDSDDYYDVCMYFGTKKVEIGDTGFTMHIPTNYKSGVVKKGNKALLAVYDIDKNNLDKVISPTMTNILLYSMDKNGKNMEEYLNTFDDIKDQYELATFRGTLCATYNTTSTYENVEYNLENFLFDYDDKFVRVAFAYTGDIGGVGYAIMNSLEKE